MPIQVRTFEPPFTDVPGAVAEIRAGRMVVVVDDEDRENEGDLTLASEHVTPEAINFMARYGRGLICLTLTEERADHLRLFPMTQQNSSRFGTAFTETIEAREGVTTGISAADRAHTIRTAIDRSSKTLRNLDWFELVSVRGSIADGQVSHYQVTMKVGFRLDEVPGRG